MSAQVQIEQPPLAVNGQRLWDSLMAMARIGATAKGVVCRLALTDLDRDGRDLFVAWARDAGCTISVDRIGNVFARRAGRDASLAPVIRVRARISSCIRTSLDHARGVALLAKGVALAWAARLANAAQGRSRCNGTILARTLTAGANVLLHAMLGRSDR